MSESGETIEGRAKRDLFLIISNSVLLVLAVAFLWIAFTRYRDQIGSVSLSESRFLTTEWHLLQQLKAQTDQQLLEKDQEISDLNRRYLTLVQGHASESEVKRIESRLRQAQSERAQILSSPDVRSAGVQPAERSWLTTLLPPPNESALTQLLQKQIQTLQTQLDERTTHIDELQKELAALDANVQGLEQERAALRSGEKELKRRYDTLLAADDQQIRELSAALERQQRAARAALDAVTAKAVDTAADDRPSIQELETRALVRALVSTPQVRSRYPDLLDSLDRYLEVYGIDERLKGQHEAYSAAAAAMAPVADDPGRR